MNKKSGNNKHEMMFHEYNAVYTSLNTFWMIRASILPVGITLIGVIAGLSSKADLLLRYICDLSLLFILGGLIKMLGTITKSIFIFSFRLGEIAEHFEVFGMWSIFPYFAKQHPENSGTAPFYYISLWLNAILAVVIIGRNAELILKNTHQLLIIVISLLIIMAAIVSTSIFALKIKRSLNPQKFLNELKADWQESRERCLTKKESPEEKGV
jgi:hypothetical protein